MMGKNASGLKKIGCPYTADDFRARLWLEGYKAGFETGHSVAADVAVKHFTGKSIAELKAEQSA